MRATEFVNESQAAKTGIMQTDVYGSRAYHARCLEPGCDWESRRYDRIQQAQAAAKKHAATHFDKKAVAEAFDQPYPLKWEKSDYGDYDALAKLDDGTFLSIMFNNEYKKNWMVEFYRNNSQAVTGEGDAQRIFATVLHAIGQFIKKKKPASIFFSAVKEDDPTGSRSKLYDRLVQRYASGLGYTVQKQEQPGAVSFKLLTQPVEENFADGITFSHSVSYDHEDNPIALNIIAHSNGQKVGYIEFATDDPQSGIWWSEHTAVNPQYQRQGIARSMYDYAKGLKNIVKQIVPSPNQSPGGKAIWKDKKVWENFADGRNPGRKGLAKRMGVNCKQPVSKLRSIAKNSSGERQRMAHWCANMKSGRDK